MCVSARWHSATKPQPRVFDFLFLQSAVSPHEECDGVRFCGSQIGPHGLDPFKGMMGPSRHLDSSFLKRKTKMWPVFDASAQILQTNAHLNVAAFFQIYKII